MPVTNRNEFDHRDVGFGICDSCGGGTISAVEVLSLNRDGSAPWYCYGCDQHHNDDEWDSGEEEYDSSRITEVESYSFQTDFQPLEARLLLPRITGDRVPRLISIEQEIGSGSRLLAQAFFDAGYSTSREVHSYGTGSGRAGGFCHIEHDSSTDAEVIYSKLRLDVPSVALQLESALSIVRAAIQADEVALDSRSGFHVHVDAKGMSMEAVENLYHLWNYLEDTIFRLASANWSSHRTEINPSDYASRMYKGHTNRSDLGRYFENSRPALNLSNYMSARSYCTCGAFSFADWQNCVCDLPKATVEFRVFNATANLRKIHAYTALSLAMVNHAIHGEGFVGMPVNEWNRSATPVHSADQTLEYILTQLPLTNSEKGSLEYCASNSSLKSLLKEGVAA